MKSYLRKSTWAEARMRPPLKPEEYMQLAPAEIKERVWVEEIMERYRGAQSDDEREDAIRELLGEME